MVRDQAVGLGQGVRCGLGVLLPGEQDAQDVVGPPQGAVQGHGLAQMGLCLLVQPAAEVGHARAGVGHGRLRLPGKNPVEDVEGLLHLVGLQQGVTVLEGRAQVVRVLARGALIVGQGHVAPAATHVHVAQFLVLGGAQVRDLPAGRLGEQLLPLQVLGARALRVEGVHEGAAGQQGGHGQACGELDEVSQM